MNPDAEGTAYPPTTFTVDPARVEAFRAVFGHADGISPTFLTTVEFLVFPQVIGDPALALDFSRVLHGTQEYAYERPLVEGETLAAAPRIDSVRVRGGTGFLTIVTEVRDPVRGARGDRALDDARAGAGRMTTPVFGDVRVGDEIHGLRRVVTRDDVRAYADAGGDRNPLHLDDAFARSVGFPGIIAHGMFTMGHMAACVVAWAGDPAAVTAISAGFRAPVFMGEELVAGGRVTAVDPEARTATLETWVTVTRDGETLWPVKKGSATVRLG